MPEKRRPIFGDFEDGFTLKDSVYGGPTEPTGVVKGNSGVAYSYTIFPCRGFTTLLRFCPGAAAFKMG